MAEINAAYRIAKQHARLRSGPAPPRQQPAGFSRSGGGPPGFVRPSRLFECEPGSFEWRELRAAKAVLLAVAIAAVAEILRRLVPDPLAPYVWLAGLVAIVGMAVLLLREPKE